LRAVSRLVFTLAVIGSLVIGALLSYLLVVGYYISLGIVVPESVTVTITNATFTPQDPSTFNITVLNPTFSTSDAQITRIGVLTEEETVEFVSTSPPLPYLLPKGESQTFMCNWSWANYSGRDLGVVVLLEDGSGATLQVRPPLVKLEVEAEFSPEVTVNRFNLTVRNAPSSVTYVNVTDIVFNGAVIPAGNLTIPLPYTLQPGEEVSLTCHWSWIPYQGMNVTIVVRTQQGYVGSWSQRLPGPVIFRVQEAVFSPMDTQHFNLTLYNDPSSPTYVNITRVTVTLENGTVREISETQPPLTPPYTLRPNASVTLTCRWNWTTYRGMNVTVVVYTQQGFTASITQTTPEPVLLAITKAVFNVSDPQHFLLTVHNSGYSIAPANITSITLTFENGTVWEVREVHPPLTPPYALPPNASVTFTCTWNWTGCQGMNVTITVHTREGFTASYTLTLPSLSSYRPQHASSLMLRLEAAPPHRGKVISRLS